MVNAVGSHYMSMSSEMLALTKLFLPLLVPKDDYRQTNIPQVDSEYPFSR